MSTRSIFPNATLPAPFLRAPITQKTRASALGAGPLLGVNFALSSMQGWRTSQEDSHSHLLPAHRRKDIGFFGVFDGHGGSRAAQYAAEHVLNFIENSDSFSFLSKNLDSMPDADILARATLEGFFNCDESMKNIPAFQDKTDMSGSTAVVVVITPQNFIIGNTGDSRAVLLRSNKTVFATHDHKPSDARETSRVENAGGYISQGRINGDLASARSFGDFRYKVDLRLPASQQQVTVMPDIAILQRSPDDQLLILACDGIWDVMSNLEASHFVLAAIRLGATLQLAADLLLDECLRKSSGDNMSVLLISLPGAPKQGGNVKGKVTLDKVRDLMYSAVL